MNTCSVKPRRKQNRLNSILKHHKGRIALCILLAVTGSLSDRQTRASPAHLRSCELFDEIPAVSA